MRKLVFVTLVFVLVLMMGTAGYAEEYTVEDANREYISLIERAQQYLNQNGTPFFYCKTENMIAVLAKQFVISDEDGDYVGYVYKVIDSAMMKAEDFPFKMKGPAQYPIVVWKSVIREEGYKDFFFYDVL